MTNQEAIKELDKLVVGEISDSPRLEKEHKTRNKALTVAIEALKQAELTKHGHWDNENKCSICGYGVMPWNNTVKYCPHCGAKMDLEVEE